MKKVGDMNWDLNHEGNIKTNHTNFGQVKELLDSKGPGFCLAKWNQVTMHLGTGVTHSCHHPGVSASLFEFSLEISFLQSMTLLPYPA